ARRGPVWAAWAPGPPGGPPRVAYAVSRKAGGAVVRNRIRRRLRAVVATTPLPPGDLLISAAPPAATIPFCELRAAVAEAVNAVHPAASAP
ncbi:MAG TPA: ribonuclease P protein component, partial [Acidimicrobiales bacterium]|nr:ribonuclease P protein component [Acidimicrobiales bacterium]